MEQNYFYVKPYQPITSTLPDDLIYKVNINEINALALFAITLEPEPEDTESFGYADALQKYYSQNDGELKETYLKLISNSAGNEFLCSTISLCLWEKIFRENGISEEMVERYNRCVNDYKNILIVNNEQYNQLVEGKKL